MTLSVLFPAHPGVVRLIHDKLCSACLLLAVIGFVSGCISQSASTSQEIGSSGASATAQALAEKAIVKPVVYENAGQQGPPLVVLPGQFKITNSTFSQKYSPNNIADFAELELDRANFKVLERAHLGPLLQEVVLAVNLGDPQGLSKFRKGKFLTTRWFVQFDVLKAEPVAEAGTEFDGKAIGDLVTTLAGSSTSGKLAGGVISSTGTSDEAKVWILGLRYKIIDAATSEVVKNNYVEDKMEVGNSSSKFLGISHTEKVGNTFDSMVQRLVQKCVAEIDKIKGQPSSLATSTGSPAIAGGASIAEQVAPIPSQNIIAKSETRPAKDRQKPLQQSMAANPHCQELRKNWQLGDASVTQRYLQECAQ